VSASGTVIGFTSVTPGSGYTAFNVDLAGGALSDLAQEAGPSPVAATYHGGEMREDRD